MTSKRQHNRYTIKSVGEIFCIDDNRQFKAFVGGISRGGMEVYSQELLKPDTRLKIAISFLDKDGKIMTENLAGRVRWSSTFQEAYIAGIQFDVIVENDIAPALDEYIKTAEEFFV